MVGDICEKIVQNDLFHSLNQFFIRFEITFQEDMQHKELADYYSSDLFRLTLDKSRFRYQYPSSELQK